MSNALEAKNISVQFGGLLAVNNVTFNIPNKSIVSLIGPNGAGKTTFFNVLTGLYKPSSGSINYGGKDITDLPPHK
ncbi:MAG: ATP-binding cassette domain-containing protein, partial [Candidatus Nanopelagicus sp.]